MSRKIEILHFWHLKKRRIKALKTNLSLRNNELKITTKPDIYLEFQMWRSYIWV